MEHDLMYPRPQFVRDNYTLYDGVWDFDYDNADLGEKEQWFVSHEFSKKIRVPFAPETLLSGIHDEHCHENVWYAKTLSVDGKQLEKHDFVLHFEGVDFLAKLWVNGVFIGCHKGGGFPFENRAEGKAEVAEDKFCVLVCADNRHLEKRMVRVGAENSAEVGKADAAS